MIQRPKPSENEADILRLQAEFAVGNRQSAVQIKRVSKETRPSQTSSEEDTKTPDSSVQKKSRLSKQLQSGRFTLNLDTLPEIESQQVLYDIQERNMDLLNDHVNNLHFANTSIQKYSEEDGFPDAIDLSSYFKNGTKGATQIAKSFFACEFDRKNGIIEDNYESRKSDEETTSSNFKEENTKRLESMKKEEFMAALKEIEERFDPKLLEFLKNRNAPKAKTPPKSPSKPQASRFKQERVNGNQDQTSKDTSITEKNQTETIKHLEVLEDFVSWKAEEKYDRLAADAIQLDLITKCARRVLPRQTQQATRLFDVLKTTSGSSNRLLELARNNIDEIKRLYLEQINDNGKIVEQFANGLNPVIDGSWMLRPIRTVFDAIQIGERSPTSDDVEVVRLTLLWTTLLFTERPTLFYTMVEASDFFVRLAELYMLGPEVFTDKTIEECVELLFDQFLLSTAKKGRLSFRLERPVAGLDAYMPFFEELLSKYEEFSVGNVGFTKVILLGAYGNSVINDAIECQLRLWSGRRNVVREMTARTADLSSIIELVKETSEAMINVYEETLYTQYSMLLTEYAGALYHQRVERERNSGIFALAANELGFFIRRHLSGEKKSLTSTTNSKEFNSLIFVLREAVKNVLIL